MNSRFLFSSPCFTILSFIFILTHGGAVYLNYGRHISHSVFYLLTFILVFILSQDLKISCIWLFCDPMDWSLPGSCVHGIFWTVILEWVAISFSRDLPSSGIETVSPAMPPALQVDSLPLRYQGSHFNNPSQIYQDLYLWPLVSFICLRRPFIFL